MRLMFSIKLDNLESLRMSGIISLPEVRHIQFEGFAIFFAFSENDIDDVVLKPLTNSNNDTQYFQSMGDALQFLVFSGFNESDIITY